MQTYKRCAQISAAKSIVGLSSFINLPVLHNDLISCMVHVLLCFFVQWLLFIQKCKRRVEISLAKQFLKAAAFLI